MKILAISHSAVIERYQQKFEFLANRFGHEIVLVIPQTWEEGGRQIVRGKNRRVGSLQVQTLPCFLRPRLRRHFYLGLARLARRFQPDLIYAEEEPQAEVTRQAAEIARKLKTIFVFFTWENIPQTYIGRKRKIEVLAYQQAAGAIVGNQDGTLILKKNGYAKPVAVIPQYGVDPGFFRPENVADLRETLKLTGNFVIGYVGRLLPEKNISALLRAATNLPDNVSVVLIGNGPERATLENLSQKLRLNQRVKFISAIKYEEMPRYFNLLEVLVLPSISTAKWKEQFGRVLIEAMACGVPVIGSDTGEIPNVVGATGLIFSAGRIDQLTDQLTRIFHEPSLRQKLSRLGRERVLSLYSNQKIAEQMDSFFNKLKERP